MMLDDVWKFKDILFTYNTEVLLSISHIALFTNMD